MTVSSLIKREDLRQIATANAAKAANNGRQQAGTLASLELEIADDVKARDNALSFLRTPWEGIWLFSSYTVGAAGHANPHYVMTDLERRMRRAAIGDGDRGL